MRVLIVTLLLLSPAFMSVSLAAKKSPADKLIDEGLDLREKQQDREALAKFEKAFEMSTSPRAQAQMALAHQALGSWLDAEANLTAAMATKDPWIEKNRAALNGALNKMRERLGRVEIRTDVEGATVRLNGTTVGTTPLDGPRFVVAGSVVIAVEADGHWPVSRRIDVEAGALARETVKLVKKQNAAPPPTASGPPASPPPATGTKTEVGGSDDTLTYVGWGLAAGAAVGVGVGVAGLLIRNGKISDYNDDSCLEGGRTRDENCGDKLSAANSAGTLSTVGFIAGGVLAAGAVVVLVLAGGSDDAATADTAISAGVWVCGGGPGEVGVGCAVRF